MVARELRQSRSQVVFVPHDLIPEEDLQELLVPIARGLLWKAPLAGLPRIPYSFASPSPGRDPALRHGYGRGPALGLGHDPGCDHDHDPGDLYLGSDFDRDSCHGFCLGPYRVGESDPYFGLDLGLDHGYGRESLDLSRDHALGFDLYLYPDLDRGCDRGSDHDSAPYVVLVLGLAPVPVPVPALRVLVDGRHALRGASLLPFLALAQLVCALLLQSCASLPGLQVPLPSVLLAPVGVPAASQSFRQHILHQFLILGAARPRLLRRQFRFA